MSRLDERRELASAASARHAHRLVSRMSSDDVNRAYFLRFQADCKNRKAALKESMAREIMILNDSGLLLWKKKDVSKLAKKLGISKKICKEIGNVDHSEHQKLMAQAIAIELVRKGTPYSIHPLTGQISLLDKPWSVDKIIEIQELEPLRCLPPDQKLIWVRRYGKILEATRKQMQEEGKAHFALLVARNDLVDKDWVRKMEHRAAVEKVSRVEAQRLLQQEVSDNPPF